MGLREMQAPCRQDLKTGPDTESEDGARIRSLKTGPGYGYGYKIAARDGCVHAQVLPRRQ